MALLIRWLPIFVPMLLVVFSASEVFSIWQEGRLWRGHNTTIALAPGVIAAVWLVFELWQLCKSSTNSR